MLHIACSECTDKTVETGRTMWNTMLRQTVIRIKPDYFALPKVECEHYQLLLNAGDKVNTTEEHAAILYRFEDSLCLLWNSMLLPLWH
jgi:hypothetical protein